MTLKLISDSKTFWQKVAFLSGSMCPASQQSMASRYGWPLMHNSAKPGRCKSAQGNWLVEAWRRTRGTGCAWCYIWTEGAQCHIWQFLHLLWTQPAAPYWSWLAQLETTSLSSPLHYSQQGGKRPSHAFSPTTTLVSYLLKRNKNVVLMSAQHKTTEIKWSFGQEARHHPGLQPQQRRRRQPGQGDWRSQLRQEDCLLVLNVITSITSLMCSHTMPSLYGRYQPYLDAR